ncbi:MAG: VOC family protein [Dehalococcoidia bacterium]
MHQTRMTRVALSVKDIDEWTAAFQQQFGMRFRWPDIAYMGDIGLRVAYGENGLEPIQLFRELPFLAGIRLPLIEVALAVDDAERVRADLEAAGYSPIHSSYLSVSDAYEHHFGEDFHGVSLMVCTDGHNEAQMSAQEPFKNLESADLPKLGCVTVIVDDLGRATADFERFFGMKFVSTDPAGLGAKAAVGRHRVKLIESPASSLAEHFRPPLAALDFVFEDAELVRRGLEQAGVPVIRERTLSNGHKAYYFGSGFQDLPIGIYSALDETEILGF